MKQVFLDIQQKLETMPELAYVGEDWGQLHAAQSPMTFPCALIGLGRADYVSSPARAQQVTVMVNITIATAPSVAEVPSAQPYGTMELVEKIHRLLSDSEEGESMRLTCTGIQKVIREDNLCELLMTWQFSYTDTTAMSVYTKVTPLPSMEMRTR